MYITPGFNARSSSRQLYFDIDFTSRAMSDDPPTTPVRRQWRLNKSLYPTAGAGADITHVDFGHGSSAQGPTTHHERFAWPEFGWSKMNSGDRDRLVRNLQRLQLTDNMSGFSCPTLIFFYITKFLKDVVGIDVPNIRCESSCDIQESRRVVLNAYEDQWRPRHIFGDHLDRLGEHAVVAQKMKPDASMSDEDKRNLNQQANRKIEATYDLLHAQKCGLPAFCKCCGAYCKTSLMDSEDTRKDSLLTMSVAGLECTDVTRIGGRAGDTGSAYRSQCSWMWERKCEQDDMMHVECGPDWEPACLTESLGETHTILSMRLCGTQVGEVNSRDRRHTFAFKKSKAASTCVVRLCSSYM